MKPDAAIEYGSEGMAREEDSAEPAEGCFAGFGRMAPSPVPDGTVSKASGRNEERGEIECDDGWDYGQV